MVERRSVSGVSASREKTVPKLDTQKERLPDFFREIDQLDLPPGEVYRLVHDYFGSEGAYEHEPDAQYGRLLGEWVLHRNQQYSQDRTVHLIIRATDTAMSELPRLKLTRRRDASYRSRIQPVDEVQDERLNHYDPTQLMVILTDGERVMDVEVDSLIGSSYWRLIKRGLGYEDIIASLTIDGRKWQRLQLARDFDSGVMNLPDGSAGWILSQDESRIEITASLTETSRSASVPHHLGRAASSMTVELVSA